MGLKKNLVSLILNVGLVAGSLSFSGCASQQTSHQKNSMQRWEFLHENKPSNLVEVSYYLFEKISSKNDSVFVDFWSSPKKTVEKGKGDCEDTAILGAYLAEPLGYPPKVLCIVGSFIDAHAVTLLEKRTTEGVKYGAIDDIDIFYPEYDFVEDLAKDIGKLYRKKVSFYKIIDLNLLDKNWRTTDKNLMSLRDKISGLVQVKY